MKVFLDMDGVLVDFMTAVCRMFKLPEPPQIYNFFEPIREEVNKTATTSFFYNLKWMHDGKEILSSVLDRFPQENIYLLTALMPNPESGTGKLLWIREHLPRWYKEQTIISTAPKHLLARSDTLLIDDKNENIDEFIEAGGRGLLVPRAWNRAHFCADQSVEVVRNFLEAL